LSPSPQNYPVTRDSKGRNRKKGLGPDERRGLVKIMLEGYDITLRRALRLIGLSSSMYYYKPKRDDSEALNLMSDYAEENPTHGQDMMVKVFHKSHGWNHKKTVRGGYSPLFRVAFERFGPILYANCMQIMKKAPTLHNVSA